MQGVNQGPKNKTMVVGTALLNLAEYASAADEQKEFELNIPLTLSGSAAEPRPLLSVCASRYEFLSLIMLDCKSFFSLYDAIVLPYFLSGVSKSC